METLLKRYLWVLDLAAIALAAVFLARAASSAIESRITVPPTKPVPRLVRPPSGQVYGKQADEILKRNVFCSGCPPLLPKADEGKAETVEQPPQKTALPIALLAIMYAPPPMGLKWSVALLRDSEEKVSGAFPVGGKLRTATITEIQETRVYIDNGGRTEFIDLLDPPKEAAAAAASATPTLATSAGDALSQEMDRGIRKVSEHNYELQRSTLESVLGNMNLLSRSARIVPEIRDGKAAGFRLYSVRPDGPFAKIGMQNGDVIASINGLEITSPEKALEVYAKLKSASHLSLGLERNGQRVNKEYNIR